MDKEKRNYSFTIFNIQFDAITLKFVIVGIINTLFGTTIMFTCYNLLHISYWWSSAANYFFGSILSYILNKHFTFRSQHNSVNEMARFVVNICACYFIAYGVAKPLSIRLLNSTNKTIQENVAMLIGMVLFVFLNYVGQRYYVFRKDND